MWPFKKEKDEVGGAVTRYIEVPAPSDFMNLNVQNAFMEKVLPCKFRVDSTSFKATGAGSRFATAYKECSVKVALNQLDAIVNAKVCADCHYRKEK